MMEDPKIPLDIVGLIASHLILQKEARKTILKELCNYSLVNRAFSSGFQPHIFRQVHISDAPLSRPKTIQQAERLLEILRGNPVLGTFVQNLSIMLHDAENNSLLPSILGRLTSLTSLSLIAVRLQRDRIKWSTFDESFRSSITRLIQLPTLRKLDLVHFDSLPASLFLLPTHLTSISISDSRPYLDLPSGAGAGAGVTDAPSYINLDVSHSHLPSLIPLLPTKAPFFSRIGSLKSTHEASSDAYLNTVLLYCSQFSTLKRIDVTFDQGLIPTQFPPRRSLDLSPLRALKDVHLTMSRPTAASWPIFIADLCGTISRMDISALENISFTVSAVELNVLQMVCEGWSGLDRVLSTKLQQSPSKLETVRINVDVNRSDHSELSKPISLVRDTLFLPSLPNELVWVVLKSKQKTVVYESRQS